MSTTVLFIHGAWLTPAIWDRFAARYAACGYRCVAPPWPMLDLSAEQLRKASPAGLGALTIARIVGHYERLIRAMPEPPVLVGHCFGGLFVQMLLDRGLGSAGVAIAPAPPRGVVTRLHSLLSSLPMLLRRPGWWRVVAMTEAQFGRSFANTLATEQRPLAYRRHIVPTPARLLFQSVFGLGNRVDFANDGRAPLLFIAGENDRTVQPSMVASNYRLQRRSVAPTAFARFAGRSHWLIAEPGWEEVADCSIAWLQRRVERF